MLLCRLCLKGSNDCERLYSESGKVTSVYEIIYHYFHPNILNMEAAKHLKVICSKCWRHIQNFQDFELSIMDAQTKLGEMFDLKTPSEENVKKEPLNVGKTLEDDTKLKDITTEEDASLGHFKEIEKGEELAFISTKIKEEPHEDEELGTNEAANKQEINMVSKVEDLGKHCNSPKSLKETLETNEDINEDGGFLTLKSEPETPMPIEITNFYTLAMDSNNDSLEFMGRSPSPECDLSQDQVQSPTPEPDVRQVNSSFLMNLLTSTDNASNPINPINNNASTSHTSGSLVSNLQNLENSQMDIHPEFVPIRQRFEEITQMADHLKVQGVRFLESLLNIEDEIVEPIPRISYENVTSQIVVPIDSEASSVIDYDIDDDLESCELTCMASESCHEDSAMNSFEAKPTQIENRPIISVVPIQVLTSLDHSKALDSNEIHPQLEEVASPVPNSSKRRNEEFLYSENSKSSFISKPKSAVTQKSISTCSESTKNSHSKRTKKVNNKRPRKGAITEKLRKMLAK
uniref:ZAD domain-containing protein n=1 Tax=Musca domestica TaxID=7370 RepID=A0A1I8MY52_MUSDO